MKKFILLICVAASVLLACLTGFAADGVPTDAEHFPDKAFRAYVSQNCDTNKDGVLSAAEIGAVKRMVLSHLDIASPGRDRAFYFSQGAGLSVQQDRFPGCEREHRS